MTIWFDMDGTLAAFYAVNNWLAYLQEENTYPYEVAKPMHNMSQLARLLNVLQRKGYKLGIISWTSKHGTESYNNATAQAKRAWLDKHLHSVQWDSICIVDYGTDKYSVCKEGVLFDDEAHNRESWQGEAFEPARIMEVLHNLNK